MEAVIEFSSDEKLSDLFSRLAQNAQLHEDIMCIANLKVIAFFSYLQHLDVALNWWREKWIIAT